MDLKSIFASEETEKRGQKSNLGREKVHPSKRLHLEIDLKKTGLSGLGQAEVPRDVNVPQNQKNVDLGHVSSDNKKRDCL